MMAALTDNENVNPTARKRRFLRWSCLAVALVLSVAAIAAPVLSPGDRQLVESITRDYLRQNPGVLRQMLAALRQKQEEDQHQEALRRLSKELRDKPASSAIGNEQADVTIVEFLDYRCPYCRMVEQSIQELLRTDGRLRVMHKQLPVLGRASVLAARMDLVAQKLGRHADFHTALMNRTGEIDEHAILDVARAINLDLNQVRNLIDSPEITAALRADIDLAKKLAFTTTPGFIVGEEVIHGAPELADLAELVAQERNLRRHKF